MSATPAFKPLTVEEFLAIRFPPDVKAELADGVIVAMAGGTRRHAEVQSNIMLALGRRLRGTGCKPFGSDLGIRTADHGLRYPDVSILCGGSSPDDDGQRASADPRIIFEILSPSTAAIDQGEKLLEYQALASVDTIVFVDPAAQVVRVVQRLGAQSWRDDRFVGEDDISLPSLNVMLPRVEVFARD